MSGAVFDSLLNHLFTLSRIRRTPDGQGGWAITYEEQFTFAGRLRPASASEVEAGHREESSVSHVLYAHYGTDIQRGDQIDGGGMTVWVLAVREPSTAHEHLEIDCSNAQLEASLPEGGGS